MAEILELKKEPKVAEMIPLDKWDGECWKTFYNEFCIEAAKNMGVDPWDVLADFIHKAYLEPMPPCKVGDDVWWIDPETNEIKCAKNDIIAVCDFGGGLYRVITNGEKEPQDIHTEWCMLSEQEAKKRLSERSKK